MADKIDELFAQVAVSNVILTAEQVEECRGIQELISDMGVKRELWKIALDKGYINDRAVSALLEIVHRRLAGSVPVAPREETLPSDVPTEGLTKMIRLKGLVSNDQIKEAEEIQSTLDDMGIARRISEILIDKHYVSREQVDDLIRRNPKLDEFSEKSKARISSRLAQEDQVLARFVTERGMVAPDKLAECSRVQAQLKGMGLSMSLLDIMSDRRLVSRQQIEPLLRAEVRKERGASGQHPTSILPMPKPKAASSKDASFVGDILVERNIATEEEIEEAEEIAARARRLGMNVYVGDVMLSRGQIGEGDLRDALDLQRKRRMDRAKKERDEKSAITMVVGGTVALLVICVIVIAVLASGKSANSPKSEEPAVSDSGSVKTPADKPVTNPGGTQTEKLPVNPNKETPVKPPVEKTPIEKPPVEKPPVEKPPVEKPPVEKPPVEKPPIEKPPVEKPPVEDPPTVDPPTDPIPDPPVPVLTKAEDIYAQAQKDFAASQWKQAWVLFNKLVKNFSGSSVMQTNRKDILAKIDECKKNMGIIMDIAQVFKGKASLIEKGRLKMLKLFYDFNDPEQLKDFNNISLDKMEIVDGAMEVTTNGYGFCNIKNATFIDYTKVEFTATLMPPSDGEIAMGVFFNFEEHTGYLFALHYKEYRDDTVFKNVIRLQMGKDYEKTRNLSTTGKPKIEVGKAYRVKIVAEKGSLQLYINGQQVRETNDTSYLSGLLRFGAYNARVRYDDISIEGTANPQWLNKAFSEATTLNLAEMEEDLKSRKVRTTHEDPLSAEAEDVLARIPDTAKDLYKKGLSEEELDSISGRNWRDWWNEYQKRVKSAIEYFTKAVEYCPEYALAFYQRAMRKLLLGDKNGAMTDLTSAFGAFPGFYEACKERGDLYLSLNKFDEAMKDYEKSIEINPEYSYGYSGRGYLRFVLGDQKGAIADLDKALVLKADNLEAQDYKRNLKHVIDGPLWPISFEKETPYYRVMSDISQEKCDLYANNLQAITELYEQTFGFKEAPKRKGRVMIFNTAEGYYTYAELSTDDRAQWTLGYYHPHFRELLLFEDVGKEQQTLRVMFHEGLHMFMHRLLEEPPIWFNEGMAEYFYASTVEPRGGKFTVTATGGMHDMRLPTIQGALQNDRMSISDFKKIMLESQRQFYGEDPGTKYAQAWSMVHFFIHGEKARYRPMLVKYYKELKAGRSQVEAFDATFGKCDLESMQKEWEDYVFGLHEEK
jgi:tetratricopeptide (TPR) repeat protein